MPYTLGWLIHGVKSSPSVREDKIANEPMNTQRESHCDPIYSSSCPSCMQSTWACASDVFIGFRDVIRQMGENVQQYLEMKQTANR